MWCFWLLAVMVIVSILPLLQAIKSWRWDGWLSWEWGMVWEWDIPVHKPPWLISSANRLGDQAIKGFKFKKKKNTYKSNFIVFYFVFVGSEKEKGTCIWQWPCSLRRDQLLMRSWFGAHVINSDSFCCWRLKHKIGRCFGITVEMTNGSIQQALVSVYCCTWDNS